MIAQIIQFEAKASRLGANQFHALMHGVHQLDPASLARALADDLNNRERLRGTRSFKSTEPIARGTEEIFSLMGLMGASA